MQLTENKCSVKNLHLTGFEPRTSGVYYDTVSRCPSHTNKQTPSGGSNSFKFVPMTRNVYLLLLFLLQAFVCQSTTTYLLYPLILKCPGVPKVKQFNSIYSAAVLCIKLDNFMQQVIGRKRYSLKCYCQMQTMLCQISIHSFA